MKREALRRSQLREHGLAAVQRADLGRLGARQQANPSEHVAWIYVKDYTHVAWSVHLPLQARHPSEHVAWSVHLPLQARYPSEHVARSVHLTLQARYPSEHAVRRVRERLTPLGAGHSGQHAGYVGQHARHIDQGTKHWRAGQHARRTTPPVTPAKSERFNSHAVVHDREGTNGLVVAMADGRVVVLVLRGHVLRGDAHVAAVPLRVLVVRVLVVPVLIMSALVVPVLVVSMLVLACPVRATVAMLVQTGLAALLAIRHPAQVETAQIDERRRLHLAAHTRVDARLRVDAAEALPDFDGGRAGHEIELVEHLPNQGRSRC